MTSRVIQITATANATGHPVLFALCENGSIWVFYDKVWKEIHVAS